MVALFKIADNLLTLSKLTSNVATMPFGRIFINVAIIIFFGVVIFYLITLPIELEASSRAIQYIREKDIADEDELESIKKVLRAASFTYIIAATLVIAQFLRLLGLSRSR